MSSKIVSRSTVIVLGLASVIVALNLAASEQAKHYAVTVTSMQSRESISLLCTPLSEQRKEFK